MRRTITTVLAAAAIGVGTAHAQDNGSETVIDQVAPDMERTLSVEAPTLLSDEGEIDVRFTQYGDNVSPEISWSAGPEETLTYALVLEDPIESRDLIVLHWALYDIQPPLTTIPEGFALGGEPIEIDGVVQGKLTQAIGVAREYRGPRPPEGDPAHNYVFQVFALDTELDLPEDASQEEIVAALDGHVLAVGELVAPFTAPQ